MYICDRSRSVGAGSATTRNTRGLTRSVIRLIVPPLPAVSRPSKTMQIFAPDALTHSCIATSSACSARELALVGLALHPFGFGRSGDRRLPARLSGSTGAAGPPRVLLWAHENRLILTHLFDGGRLGDHVIGDGSTPAVAELTEAAAAAVGAPGRRRLGRRGACTPRRRVRRSPAALPGNHRCQSSGRARLESHPSDARRRIPPRVYRTVSAT